MEYIQSFCLRNSFVLWSGFSCCIGCLYITASETFSKYKSSLIIGWGMFCGASYSVCKSSMGYSGSMGHADIWVYGIYCTIRDIDRFLFLSVGCSDHWRSENKSSCVYGTSFCHNLSDVLA